MRTPLEKNFESWSQKSEENKENAQTALFFILAFNF